MGYGSRALDCLNAFYSGEYLNLDEVAKHDRLTRALKDEAMLDPVCLRPLLYV